MTSWGTPVGVNAKPGVGFRLQRLLVGVMQHKSRLTAAYSLSWGAVWQVAILHLAEVGGQGGQEIKVGSWCMLNPLAPPTGEAQTHA